MNVLTSRIDKTSGIVASTKGSIRRVTPLAPAVAAATPSTTSGPVQPATTNATAVSANARTSLVAGLRPTYGPVGARVTNSGGAAWVTAPGGSGVLGSDCALSHREAGDHSMRQSREDDEDHKVGDRLVDRIAEEALAECGAINIGSALAQRGHDDVRA